LRVSWSVKKTNEWILKKAEVRKKLLKTVKAKKLAYYGHTMRKQGSCLEKEIMQGTTPGACKRGRPREEDHAQPGWTRLTMESQSEWQKREIKWKKYSHGVANPRIKDN